MAAKKITRLTSAATARAIRQAREEVANEIDVGNMSTDEETATPERTVEPTTVAPHDENASVPAPETTVSGDMPAVRRSTRVALFTAFETNDEREEEGYPPRRVRPTPWKPRRSNRLKDIAERNDEDTDSESEDAANNNSDKENQPEEELRGQLGGYCTDASEDRFSEIPTFSDDSSEENDDDYYLPDSIISDTSMSSAPSSGTDESLLADEEAGIPEDGDVSFYEIISKLFLQ